MYDPHTRESRGFAFVTMETAEEAEAAIAALNATDLLGKVMNVEKVRFSLFSCYCAKHLSVGPPRPRSDAHAGTIQRPS